MTTNEMEWLDGMYYKDTIAPGGYLKGEMVYTMYLADFFRVPDVNFRDVALVDVHLKSLFN